MSEQKENQTAYHAAAPYPPVQAGQINQNDAKLMLDNLGGRNSEMSAISLYFYNTLITEEHKEIANVFHRISIVEMHHLEIFGKLAKQLGADPRLWVCQGNKSVYWSPGYHFYPTHLPALLDYAMEEEQAAINKYKKQTCCIANQNIVNNLQRIIQDEELHIQLFAQLKKQYCP